MADRKELGVKHKEGSGHQAQFHRVGEEIPTHGKARDCFLFLAFIMFTVVGITLEVVFCAFTSESKSFLSTLS